MVFELDDVSLVRGGRPVLGGLRFRVDAGERVVLLGVNGSGKSSLLKLLDALLFPTEGACRYDGAELTPKALRRESWRRRFRSEVALLFQNVDAMLFNPTVADELAFGPRQLGLPHIPDRVGHWAEVFGVQDLLDRPPFQLSGGEKKRVALAALLAVEPRVLLLDEATAGLDPAWSARLVDLLGELEGVTVVASTHQVTQAEELGRRALLLAPGHPGVFFDGPTEALLGDLDTLVASGLAHRHRHRHGGETHAHYHLHDLA